MKDLPIVISVMADQTTEKVADQAFMMKDVFVSGGKS